MLTVCQYKYIIAAFLLFVYVITLPGINTGGGLRELYA